MSKADVPVRKRRIVAKWSLMGNKESGEKESAHPLPHKTKYLKMSIYLRNSG